ncbi:MAG: hypothetical protein ACYDBV_00355 [Nitrospiria bacterium]
MPLTLTPQLQLSERYIDYQDSNSNFRMEDFVSSPSMSLNLDYHPALFQLKGGYSLSPAFYARESSLNSINQEGSMTFSADRPLWSASVKGTIVSTTFPDLISQYNGGIITPGSQYLQKGGDFEWKYSLTRGSSLSLNYDYFTSDYNSNQLFNSETQSAGSSLAYDSDALNQFVFSGGASLYRYPAWGESKTATANVQWNHQLGRFTSLQAGTGMGVITGYYKFFLANLSVTRNYEKGKLQAGYSRSLSPGGGLSPVPVLNQQLTGSLSREFMEGLSGAVSASYGESFAFQPDYNFHLRFWNSSLSLSYELLNWLNSSLSLSHYDQRLDGQVSDNLRSNQVMVTLSSNFSPWRPFK